MILFPSCNVPRYCGSNLVPCIHLWAGSLGFDNMDGVQASTLKSSLTESRSGSKMWACSHLNSITQESYNLLRDANCERSKYEIGSLLKDPPPASESM